MTICNRGFLSLKRVLLLLLFIGGAGSCGNPVVSLLPEWPVYYELILNSARAKPLLTPGGYLMITQPEAAYSAIGFGGLLIVRAAIDDSGTGDDFYAYDLACPLERDREVKVYVNKALNAECPKCKSQYSILYGGGNPIEGDSKSPLRSYRVIRLDNRLIISNK